MRKVLFFLAIALLPSLVFAQSIYRYDVKYLCGKQVNPPQNAVAGVYSTSINVYSEQPAQFKKRFTVSLIGEQYGGTTPNFGTTLLAERSLQIDCDNIINHLLASNVPLPGGQVVEGFAIIMSPVKLDIVAVYSAGTAGGPVSALHMERVPIAP
jgi:hypothetical protein